MIKGIASSFCLLASFVAGCQLGTTVHPVDSTARLEPLRLTHYTWREHSKGPGFHRTEWHTVEIDFTKNRIRMIGGITRRPAPRLLRPDRSKAFDPAWHDLPRDRRAHTGRAALLL